MDENQQILKSQFEKLPKTLRDFVSKGNWSASVLGIAKKINLTQEKYASFENEVLFVLIGLQPKTDFVENIKNELEIDSNMAGWIAEDVEKNIFGKVANEIDEMWQAIEQNGEEDEENVQEETNENLEKDEVGSTVGQSFEDIILNQAKAMMPAVPPENLPTGPEPQHEVHDYPTGQDPYREPAE